MADSAQSTKTPPSTQKKKLLLRLSPELYDELARWAEDEFRSINGQIEFLLTQQVKKHRKGGGAGES